MAMDQGDVDVVAAVRASYEQLRSAMVAGDADALDDLITADFTLTHMTGRRQQGVQWVADVRTGTMTYHGVENVDVLVDASHDSPVVSARTQTEATIGGNRGTWPLRLRLRLVLQSERWLVASMVASTWR